MFLDILEFRVENQKNVEETHFGKSGLINPIGLLVFSLESAKDF